MRAPPGQGRCRRDLPGQCHRLPRRARHARRRRGAARSGGQTGPAGPHARAGARAPTGTAPRSPSTQRGQLDSSTWRRGATRSRTGITTRRSRSRRGQDVELMLAEGALLFERAARAIRQPPGAARPAAARTVLTALARKLRDRGLPPWDRLAADPAAASQRTCSPGTRCATWSPGRRGCPLLVDRERALFGSWYEFFPRSEGVQFDPMGRREPVSGTLRHRRAAAARRSRAMGFDVVYLPPVHPIGTTFRKGRNNTLEAGPGDPGSPWAIGSADGGHDAIHPDLGTFADFTAFVSRASGPRPGGRHRPGAECVARPPRGSRSTRSGSPPGPTGPSPTRRTRRRSTRTSIRSTSTTILRASTRK